MWKALKNLMTRPTETKKQEPEPRKESPKITIVHAMDSKPGTRPYNEDTIQAADFESGSVFVLADGLGGHGHGEIASAKAAGAVMAQAEDAGLGQDFIMTAIEKAQEAVLSGQKEMIEYRNMSTTLVVLKIADGKAQWGHIGDSRLYMFRNNAVLYQTLDHSVPQMLVALGEIKPEDIRKHPDRSRLLHVVGGEWSGKPYVVSDEIELNPGDAFLLCSDGFWELIEESNMCELLKDCGDVHTWLSAMQQVVEENGKNTEMDNYSAICVQIEG